MEQQLYWFGAIKTNIIYYVNEAAMAEKSKNLWKLQKKRSMY
jgi:hypothetical protein